MLPKISYPLTMIDVPSTKTKIQTRPMLAKDEKLLLMAKESPPQDRDADILNAIKQIVTNCIVSPKNVDVDKFSIFDIEYLFIKLREYSAAPTIKVSYKDGEDQDIYEFEIPLKEIKVKFPEKISKMIEINDTTAIRMKYPEAALYSDQEFKGANGKTMMDLLIKKTIDAIVQDGASFSFADAPPDESQTFLDELPLPTLEKIREFLSNLPSVHYEIAYKNKMEHERKITLSSLTDFFSFA